MGREFPRGLGAHPPIEVCVIDSGLYVSIISHGLKHSKYKVLTEDPSITTPY